MDPVFTLQWPEFLMANRLQDLLPKSQGYSVLVPASRQERGIDLAIIRKKIKSKSRVVTIQIKASRTYLQVPPRRETTQRMRFHTWFNRFDVPEEADFCLLVGMYAPNSSQTTGVGPEWYRDCTLLFTLQEMKDFMSTCLTVGGKPDGKFSFGFNDDSRIVQTRGDQDRRSKDFTRYLLDKRIGLLRQKLGD